MAFKSRIRNYTTRHRDVYIVCSAVCCTFDLLSKSKVSMYIPMVGDVDKASVSPFLPHNQSIAMRDQTATTDCRLGMLKRNISFYAKDIQYRPPNKKSPSKNFRLNLC